ncbi:MAG: hypothetical protein H6838_04025 [Planctomycetes bacterium]|nr:hypothetical protein [Planctomycetota bacterium]MCB9884634.1 hypothetical protein [Planctomycetota bacterium]
MRDEQVFFAFALPVFCIGVGFAIHWTKQRNDLRKKRLQVLETALRHPSLDEPTRAEILRVLAEEHVRGNRPLLDRLRPWMGIGHALLITGGWLFFVGGLMAWGYAALNGYSWRSTEPCIVASIVGFVILTLPTAVREGLGRGRKQLSVPR